MGCSSSKAAYGVARDDSNSSHPSLLASQGKSKEQLKDENTEFKDALFFLEKVPLFKQVQRDQRPLLCKACVRVDKAASSDIIKQGDSGHEFFIIREGTAAVIVDDVEVANLKAGDYFGEASLLRDEPRSATIRSKTAISLLRITREDFQRLGLDKKLRFAHRKAVGCGGDNEGVAKAPSPKDEQERAMIAKALHDNSNLQDTLTLDDDRVSQLVDVAWKESIKAGDAVIKQGDSNANYFYIVQEGTFEVWLSDPEIDDGAAKQVGTVSKGGSFGELALLYFAPRFATVKATTDATVWVIDRHNFKSILMKACDKKLAEYEKHINNVSMFQPLTSNEKHAMAAAMMEMHFDKDEMIIEQGDRGNTFYILYDGDVQVIVDGEEKVRLSASEAAHKAQHFGERALLQDDPRAATVKVASEHAKVLVLDRPCFDMLLGPLENLLKRTEEEKNKAALCPSQVELMNKAENEVRAHISKKDLTKIGLLGCGGFGSVDLYEHKKTGESYAMKSLNKGWIVKNGQQKSVMNERSILLMTNSPFIIKLHECYNGTQTLYFLMDVALGGELYETYQRKGFYGSETHCKFYIAGTVCAFEHLHERHIIYRDLKPENLLLNSDGYVKLTDMGLAKFVIGKTFTTCGTPDYFAPELITSDGHTQAADWWTLGILIFELMSGSPPFEATQPMQTYKKVVKGIEKVPMPAKCRGNVGDLIKALLKADPFDRLAMRPGGVQNIEKHQWFSGFEWEKIKALELTPPYVPVVKSKNDIGNFSASEEDRPAQLVYKDDGSGWDKDFATC